MGLVVVDLVHQTLEYRLNFVQEIAYTLEIRVENADGETELLVHYERILGVFCVGCSARVLYALLGVQNDLSMGSNLVRIHLVIAVVHMRYLP